MVDHQVPELAVKGGSLVTGFVAGLIVMHTTMLRESYVSSASRLGNWLPMCLTNYLYLRPLVLWLFYLLGERERVVFQILAYIMCFVFLFFFIFLFFISVGCSGKKFI